MSTNQNAATVTLIGKGERLTETAVAAIVATLPADFDATKRGAISAAVVAWAADGGTAPAQKRGPKGEQVTTDFGRGVDTLTRAVKRALSTEDDSPKPVVLRASLSGEGGGSVTIPEDHSLYAALVNLIREGQAEAAA